MRAFMLSLAVLVTSQFALAEDGAPVNAHGDAKPGDRLLWYNRPAGNWGKEALPIGNGRMGGMVFGGTEKEHIQFNVDSLWIGDEKDVGAYQAFGDLYIEFGQTETESSPASSKYGRSLNLKEGVHRISYHLDGVNYRREYFASCPAGVMVFHFTADRNGAYTGTIQLTDTHEGTITTQGNRITSSGSTPGRTLNGIKQSYWIRGNYDISLDYEAQVLVLNDGGTLKAGPDGTISFKNCDGLTVLLAADTDYLNQRDRKWKGEHPHKRLSSQLAAASKKSFKELRKEHIKDYQSLFNRFTLDIGTTPETTLQLPTDERLARYKQKEPDPDLEELIFQYSRYLMIGCSRPGTLPANLQGIWNKSNSPIWECDLHSNINLQMNYWFVHPANLSECFLPLAEWVNSIREVRKEETRRAYRTRGWVVRSKNGIFAGSTWRRSHGDAAWIAQNLWSHYLFTLDEGYLRTRAYPVMKELCEFWEDYLKEIPRDFAADYFDPERSRFWKAHLKELPDGTLICPDGWSPEQKHIPREDGVSYDQQLVWDLFGNFVEASQALDEDAEFRKKILSMKNRLLGPKIGKWGQLQEWIVDRDDPKDQHRHLSHMIAVFPGRQISPLTTPKLAQAVRVSMNARGDGSAGWSRVWKINIWARLHDGNHAYKVLSGMITNNYYDNLFSGHPAILVDGNFGYASGVCEMLLQSHRGEIHLLPALPEAWPAGEVKGMLARGGFEVDIQWKAGKLSQAAIHSEKGGICRLRAGIPVKVKCGFSKVKAEETGKGVISFPTKAGREYRVSGIVP